MADKVSSFADRLKEGMDLRNLKSADLVQRTGLTKQKISQYVNGRFEAKQDGVYLLAKALDVNEAWLMGYDVSMNRHKKIDPATSAIEAHKQAILSRVPLLDVPVSAGQGTWVDEGCEYTYVDFNDAPKGTDFALRVRGDSMTPLYNNDDIVFVKQNVIVESGQIGIFVLNNEGYMKMLQGNRLISLNHAYAPIIINEWDTFFCAGRVIGKK